MGITQVHLYFLVKRVFDNNFANSLDYVTRISHCHSLPSFSLLVECAGCKLGAGLGSQLTYELLMFIAFTAASWEWRSIWDGAVQEQGLHHQQ